MNRKITVLTLCAMLFALCGSVEAQQPKSVPKMGYLDNSTAAGSAELLEAFRKQMTQLGWVEGKNLTIEYRFGESKGPDRLAELAIELVRLKSEVSATLHAAASVSPRSSQRNSAIGTFPFFQR